MNVRLHRQFFGHLKHLADERVVLRRQVIQRGNVLSGSNQQVDWRLRPQVLESNHKLILMDKLRLCIVSDDSAK
jgi:hypothetical protein